MKVAVYTIALNEAQFVARVGTTQLKRDADYICSLLDTGSTDDTVLTAHYNLVEVASNFQSLTLGGLIQLAILSAVIVAGRHRLLHRPRHGRGPWFLGGGNT
jgi:hypothetical protein